MANAAAARTIPISGWAVAVFFVLLPAAGASGALAFAPTQALAGIASAGAALPHLRRPSLALLLILAFTLWAAASTLWSAYGEHTQALKLTAGVACGLSFVAAVDANWRIARAAAAAAVLVLAALLVGEALSNMFLVRSANPDQADPYLARTLGRAGTTLVCIAWGGAAILMRGGGMQKALAILLLAATAFVSTKFDMDANEIGFVLALAASAVAVILPRATLIALTMGIAAWLVIAPWAIRTLPPFSEHWPDSWAMREAIWRYAADRIAERPWTGWGLDGPRAFTEMIEVRGIQTSGIPLHPHSASLQIWLETGGIGAASAACALLVGGFGLARQLAHDRLAAAAAAGAFAAFALFANVSYGAWQEWWIATLFIAAALVAAGRAQSARS